MPAGVISISTPMSSSGSRPRSSGSASSAPGASPSSVAAHVGAAQDRARSGVLAHQAQAPAAAREELPGQLLEVLRGGREGRLEGLADLAVGVADEALELAQRGLEVLALALELLDVRERLVVLGLGQRVDRPELLAAALQALDARAQAVGGLGVERLGGRLRLEAQARGERAELRGGLVLGVAHLLGADLGGRDGVAALAQAVLDLGLLGGARAQGGGHPLARLAVGQQLGVERLDAHGDGLQGAGQRRDQAVRHRQQRPIAHEGGREALDARRPLGALARGALGHPALGGELTGDLGPAHGRLALLGRPRCARR